MRQCKECNAIMEGVPVNRFYCDECRKERRREASLSSYYKRKDKENRRIGAEAECAGCGGQMVVKAANHRYCESCAELKAQASRRAYKKRQRGDRCVRVSTTLSRAELETLTSLCKRMGISESALVRSGVRLMIGK